MDAVSIMLSRPCFREINMPDEIGAFFHPDAMRLFRVVRPVKKAEVHRSGIF